MMKDTDLPPRNSFDDLPSLVDGTPNLHRLLPQSFLLRAAACVQNGYANSGVAQYLSCLLYAIDGLYERNNPVTKEIEEDVRDYWLKLPKLSASAPVQEEGSSQQLREKLG